MTDTQTQVTSNLTTLPASPPRYADCPHLDEIIITDDRPLYCADCGQAIHAEAAARFCVGVLATEYREDGEFALEMLSSEKEKFAAAVEGYLYHNPGATGDDTMACARSAWERIRTETDKMLRHSQ
jgi:hypothetical protein